LLERLPFRRGRKRKSKSGQQEQSSKDHSGLAVRLSRPSLLIS
jgi:hypothetical protein